MKKILLSFCLVFLIHLLALSQPKYEFRAAWIATVDNIDWPSRGNFNTESQKQEYTRALDMHKRNGMNAVIVQIRPATDAFYPSPYEPWSQWLTGKQGQPPYPYYDPLRFMIDEAHKRGMEFHAWCNPYRAEFAIGKSPMAADHVTKRFPEWFLTYGTQKFFDPGNKEGQQFVVKVVRDIVSRYNVDAIHFDDYFYPYRIAGKEFPDDASYKKYGNGLTKDDWRRSNVDSIILMLSKAIKEENPDCRFGISPFCVWRNSSQDPEGSATKAGMNNYDDLYADILLWLKEGWIDYVAPQLYLEFEHKAVPYDVIIDWWAKHTYGKHCYIGLAMYKAGSNANWKKKDQLPKMIRSLRNYPEIQGAIYFSSKSFENNPNGWSDSLRENYYRYPAVIPSMEWIDTTRPLKPIVVKVAGANFGNSFVLNIQKPVKSKNIKTFVVYSFRADDKILDMEDPRNIVQMIASSSDASILLSRSGNENRIFAVSSIDTNNNESELVFIE
jgi:uncharacterized lipoprotein YddW (UPF0748 family)